MARVELAPGVIDDFDRIVAHLERVGTADTAERIAGIVRALDLLAESPRIGRPVRGGKRELVIGRRTRGYVALYRYAPRLETVFVLAVRAQREARPRRPSAGTLPARRRPRRSP